MGKVGAEVEQDFKFLKPYVVTVVEVRQKQLIVYAESENEAAASAIDCVKRDVVTVDATDPVFACKTVKEYDCKEKKWYPRYRMEGNR